MKEVTRVIEPSEDELKNGWTEETLTSYINDREKGQTDRILQKAVRPSIQNYKYRPHRWRQ